MNDFFKEMIYGIPMNPNLTRNEQILQTQREQLDFLRQSLPLKSQNTTLNIRNIPQLDRVIDAQKDLARSFNSTNYTAQLLLENSRLQNSNLENLNEHAVSAYNQRNDILNSLGSIQYELAAGLGELGQSIADLTNETIKTRLETIEEIKNLQGVFLWSHREQMQLQNEILDVLKNPQQTRADESFRIGEKCRSVGDIDSAVNMYWRSLEDNPSEAKAYFGLGMIYLNYYDPIYAQQFFNACAAYSEEKSLISYALMYLGKLSLLTGDKHNAEKFFRESRNNSISGNLESCYNLSILCHYQIGFDSGIFRNRAYKKKVLKFHPELVPDGYCEYKQSISCLDNPFSVFAGDYGDVYYVGNFNNGCPSSELKKYRKNLLQEEGIYEENYDGYYELNDGKKYNRRGEIEEEGTFRNGSLSKGKRYYKGEINEEGLFRDGSLSKGKRYYKGEIDEEGLFRDGNLIQGKSYHNGKLFEEGEFKRGSLLNGKRFVQNSVLDYKNGEFTGYIN